MTPLAVAKVYPAGLCGRLWSPAMPGSVASEWVHVGLGALLFISPWALGYTDLAAATWTSWVIDRAAVVVPGDLGGSLRRLVTALDAWLEASPLLSHLLWREADTHDAVRDALAARFRWMVAEIRAVMRAALPDPRSDADIRSAAKLLALAVSYRHSTARHIGAGPGLEPVGAMRRELDFLADALARGSRPGPDGGVAG